MESVVTHSEERIVVGGTSNLAKVADEYTVSVGPVLEALEENVVLLRLLGEQSVGDDVSVRIGVENPGRGSSGGQLRSRRSISDCTALGAWKGRRPAGVPGWHGRTATPVLLGCG